MPTSGTADIVFNIVTHDQLGFSGTVSGNIHVDFTTLSVTGTETASNVAGVSYAETSFAPLATFSGNSNNLDYYRVGSANPGQNSVFFTFSPNPPYAVITAGGTVDYDSYSGAGPGTVMPVCFASGTLIRTARGDITVEQLEIGDIVLTYDGRRKPIRWIGQREVHFGSHPNPRAVWPYRVKAGAFGRGLPYADLWLSPGHALASDGLLVPVRALRHDDAVVQVEVDRIIYWHVEVDGHDVLLANGLPAESYLDTGNRCGFDNPIATTLHFSEKAERDWEGRRYCLPLVESGPRLAAVREALFGSDRPALESDLGGGTYLLVDGKEVRPQIEETGALRFVIPAGAADIRLLSPNRPGNGKDERTLGVLISSLQVSDGGGWRSIPLDHPDLFAGFHALECDTRYIWRWTDGSAHFSSRLLSEGGGPALLRIEGMFSGLFENEPSRSRTPLLQGDVAA